MALYAMNPHALWPCVCIAAGLCILVLGILIRLKLKASESWPKTTGVILESSIQPEWVGPQSDRIYVVSPQVIYEYEVGGKKYQSSQLALVTHNTANADTAREKAAMYSAGQQVAVYYDPRKPEFATLLTGDPTNGILPLGMTAFGIVAAIVGSIWLLATSK